MKGSGLGVFKRIFGLPQTKTGQRASYLIILFFMLFGIWLTYVKIHTISRPTFFSDPLHAVLILAAAVSATSGGLLAVYAWIIRKELSILNFMSLCVGSFVLYWAIAEFVGH